MVNEDMYIGLGNLHQNQYKSEKAGGRCINIRLADLEL